MKLKTRRSPGYKFGALLLASLLALLPVATFAATQSASTIGLTISDVNVSGITSTGSTITWTTDTVSSSRVVIDTEYHADPDDYPAFTEDPALVTSHSISLTGLTASTTYHYRVQSVASGNLKAFSEDATFQTSSGGGGGGGFGGGLGGGGGGGGSVTGPGETNLTLYVNSDGVFAMSGYAYSDDKLAYLYFPKGVQALDKDGHGLKNVSIKPLADNIPAPPPSAAAFSLPYEFGPVGAAFTPGATLGLIYDPAKLPSGLNPANLVLMTWDPAGKAWIAAEGAVVDTSAHTVSVTVTHLGLYQLFGTLKPASFSLRSVEVSPGEVNIGEAVTVRASVANTGNLEGEYTVTLKVNGEVAATQKVALAGGGSTTVSFTVTRDAAGTYEVDVNGQQAAFNVWAVGPVEPEFVLKSLAVFPYETTYGEAAVISVVAENKGDAAVTRTVVFKIDGTVMSTQEVSLAPRSEKTVEYTAANCEPGVHAVDVNYLQASFNVRPLLIAPPPSDINWYLIGLIIFAVTTLSSTVGFRLKSRTQYIPPVPPPVRRRTNGSGY